GRGHVGDKKFAPGCRDRSSLLGAGAPVARRGCRGGRRGGSGTQGSLRGGAGGGEGRPLRCGASRRYVTPELVQAPHETVEASSSPRERVASTFGRLAQG